MNCKLLSMCCGIAVAAALVVAPVGLADQAKDSKPAQPAGGAPTPEQVKAMKAMEEYSALNENHGYLKQFEGEWTAECKFWMSPDAPPMANKATSNAKVGFDGHYLIEKFKGEFQMDPTQPPQPFEGMSTMGYDNYKKQFFSTWIDSSCSGLMTQWGTASQGGKVFTLEGDSYCPLNGKVCHFKSVATIIDANTRKLEMWGPNPADGKVYKSMEIMYKKK